MDKIYRIQIKRHGFTLIELLIFIIILGILGSTLLGSYTMVLRNTPIIAQSTIASELAEQCISWYIGQRKLNGYSSIASPSATVPIFCEIQMPTGYSISTSIGNASISSDSNYKMIMVNVNYGGIRQGTASLLIADY